MPFARFTELALYCPVYGYYEGEKDRVGKRGDFYTNVSVGSLFGEMLAFQFSEWLDECGVRSAEGRAEADSAHRLQIVEAGAHDAKLGADILRWLRRRRPDLFARLEYWIVEPSAHRQEWQSETLREFAPQVRWLANLKGTTQSPAAATNTPHSGGVHGIIFSNELLDAVPVRRFGWDAQQRVWFEWGVAVEDGRFVWRRMPRSGKPEVRSPKSEIVEAFLQVPPALLEVLPDRFTIEASPAAENCWREAAQVLEHGRLMTLDYGLTQEELFQPGRIGGTLRAYHRHQSRDDVLANVGEQDITAHVNFTALQTTGETAGLATEVFTSQAQFLTRIAERIWKNPKLFGEWTAQHTRQFQTLTHPEHLGRAFRVLVQSR